MKRRNRLSDNNVTIAGGKLPPESARWYAHACRGHENRRNFRNMPTASVGMPPVKYDLQDHYSPANAPWEFIMRKTLSCLAAVLLAALLVRGARAVDDPAAPGLPESWLTAWNSPPMADRPLQIIHGINLEGALPDGIASDSQSAGFQLGRGETSGVLQGPRVGRRGLQRGLPEYLDVGGELEDA